MLQQGRFPKVKTLLTKVTNLWLNFKGILQTEKTKHMLPSPGNKLPKYSP